MDRPADRALRKLGRVSQIPEQVLRRRVKRQENPGQEVEEPAGVEQNIVPRAAAG
jgi:hypothetical protein